MANYKVRIIYDGSMFSGWQRLGNDDNTIQNRIEEVLSDYLNETIKIIGSGRTDKGVHAKHQIANFHTNVKFSIDEFCTSINRKLPEGIMIGSIEIVREEFHSRYDAVAKTYEYVIKEDAKWSPDDDLYCYRLTDRLDIEKMIEAAKMFEGKKDFRAFTTMKDESKSCIRTIQSIQVTKQDSVVRITVIGDGFLYNMVRIIVGTLIEIGEGLRTKDSIHECLSEGVRAKAGYLVPPVGLYLLKVGY